MEINYNNDYVQALDELEFLRTCTILLPISVIKVRNFRRDGKEREANALEYWMKTCEKDWHYRDPKGEQSLSEFAHDELGRCMSSWKEQSEGKSR